MKSMPLGNRIMFTSIGFHLNDLIVGNLYLVKDNGMI